MTARRFYLAHQDGYFKFGDDSLEKENEKEKLEHYNPLCEVIYWKYSGKYAWGDILTDALLHITTTPAIKPSKDFEIRSIRNGWFSGGPAVVKAAIAAFGKKAAQASLAKFCNEFINNTRHKARLEDDRIVFDSAEFAKARRKRPSALASTTTAPRTKKQSTPTATARVQSDDNAENSSREDDDG